MKTQLICSLMIGFCLVFGYAQSAPPPPPSAPTAPGTVLSFASGIYNQAVAVDPSGNIWIAGSPDRVQYSYEKVQKLSFLQRIINHATKQGDDDQKTTYSKWVSGPGQPSVIEMSPSGQILRNIPLQPGPGWTPGDWWGPFSIAIDSAGNIWIPIVVNTANLNCSGIGTGPYDQYCYYVTAAYALKINPQGIIAGDFSIGNSVSDQWISYVAADSSGNIFFTMASDKQNAGMVSRLDSSGALQGAFKLSNRVYKVATDNAGNIWGTNTVSDNITGGSFTTGGFRTINTHHASTGIAIDQQGNIVVGGNAHEIEKISPAGDILWTTPIQNNTGEGPNVIKIDSAGNIWAVNQMNKPNQGSAVVELNPQGGIMATYPMPNATDLAIDKQGNVWVTNDLQAGNNLYEIVGAASGPQYSP